ncbi:MAG: 30S ribosomal protein S18 [Holosporaceae bacterium]|jgi:small subunit ribosomal protein S18|nr:30S ribosomal protein S18 [Holosporaceae bacterium]
MGDYSKQKNKQKEKNPSWKRQSYKKKACPFESGVLKIDYKDPRPLQKFISERGKVIPCRISAVSARKQRAMAIAIKRARYLALLPYVAD